MSTFQQLVILGEVQYMEIWGSVERTVATCFFGSARWLSQISLPWLQKILDLAKAFVISKCLYILRNLHISTPKASARQE